MRIRLEPKGQQTLFTATITDTGSGVPANQLDSIFEPFSQVQDVMTRSTGGRGSGLSSCRYLSVIMGGRLEVESRVDEGSRFSLMLTVDVVEGGVFP